jgi:hypothetical protein
MPSILTPVRYAVKHRLLRNLRRCTYAGLRLRYLILINLLEGRTAYVTAQVLGVVALGAA